MQTRHLFRPVPILGVLFMWIFFSVNSLAQEYKYEAGGQIGTSFYMGDANKTNFFYQPGFVAGGLYRYNINFHWAIKGNLLGGTVSGNTANSREVFPEGKTTSFNRTFIDFGGQVEYNFFPFSDKYKYLGTKIYTPYLLTGVGTTFATGRSLFFNANLAVGAGFKYKIKRRLNIGIEWSIKKLFGDDFDVTKKEGDWNLDAPYGIKSSFMKNQDWYSLTMIFVTWDFGLRSDPCRGH